MAPRHNRKGKKAMSSGVDYPAAEGGVTKSNISGRSEESRKKSDIEGGTLNLNSPASPKSPTSPRELNNLESSGEGVAKSINPDAIEGGIEQSSNPTSPRKLNNSSSIMEGPTSPRRLNNSSSRVEGVAKSNNPPSLNNSSSRIKETKKSKNAASPRKLKNPAPHVEGTMTSNIPPSSARDFETTKLNISLPVSSEGPERSETVIRIPPSVNMTNSTPLSLLESVAAESLAFAANAPTSVQAQLSRLLAIIQRPVVDVLQLRGVVLSQGLPPTRFCAPSLRSLIWKLLLGVIPPIRSEWMSHLGEKRRVYDEYVFDLVQEPEEVSNLRLGTVSSPSEGAVSRKPAVDHPLALLDSPGRWRRYWSDQEVFDQVNKDVFRTRPGMHFFTQEGDSRLVTPRGNAATLSMIETTGGPVSPKKLAFKAANIVSPKSHYDRMARILFLYAKLNFGYIQGMNEILAPIYFTFYQDVLEGHFVEADSFWALSAVMAEQRDVFCQNLDESSTGMYGRLAVIQSLLAKADPEVAAHLSKIGVKMDFFALRWIMLLFAQEFDMPSTQILWDAIFSDQNPASRLFAGSTPSALRESLLVHYIAVAMIRKVRTALLDGDFADAMRCLKQYPPFEAQEIVEEAMRARRNAFNVSSSILSTGSMDVVAVISPELHNSPTSRTPKGGDSPKKKKTSLSTRIMNFVRRKPKQNKASIHPFN